MRRSRDLHRGWTVEPGRLAPDASVDLPTDPLPATVPGCVHTDLLDHGLLPDPFHHTNEDTQHWVGRSAWTYRTSFTVEDPDAARHDLVFDGLDTVARVELNGRTLGRTENMHRTHRFDVGDHLRPGRNDLLVELTPVREYTDAVLAQTGPRPNEYPEPFQYVRKMACSFGWDWGPTLTTAGIWKDVRLESWRGARIGAVRPVAGLDDGDGVLAVEVDVVADGQAGDGPLTVTVEVDGRSASTTLPAGGSGTARLQVRVPDVEVWWPTGHGDQPLYGVTVDLEEAGTPLDRWSRRTGFRTVSVTSEPDEAGTSFVLTVNDVPLFVRGVNWIPDDALVSRVTAADYRERLGQAAAAGVTLVRVWGGGIYERDELYDVCDELGLLVWQDFLFACAAYPETPTLLREVEAEARENVTRLMPHPSLVLWNGNNENLWGFVDWGWREQLDGKEWGLGYYTDLLPRVLAETDPSRPYVPGSPFSPSPELHPNDPDHALHHSWDVWNRLDYRAYTDVRPRFVAEFGYQAPPAWSTLVGAVEDDPVRPDSAGVLHHQKAADGNGKLARGMAPHLPDPVDVDDWHYLTQVTQAQAITVAVEHYRALWPHCSGAILWQLNDCWPVTSWAAVDGAGRRKPLWYALRRLYADRLLLVRPGGGAGGPGGLEVVLVNDAPDAVAGVATVRRRRLTGEVLATWTGEVDVPARGRAAVGPPPDVAVPGDPAEELLEVEAAGLRTLHLFVEDRELRLPPPRREVDVRDVAGGVEVTVVARSLVRHLVLNSDRLDPASTVDDQLVTLLPGDRHTFRVRTTVAAADPRWSSAPALRCLGDAAPAG